ncbi:MAG: hypothetical protein ACREXY_24790 [Gammaproteobacteria bacterium]
MMHPARVAAVVFTLVVLVVLEAIMVNYYRTAELTGRGLAVISSIFGLMAVFTVLIAIRDDPERKNGQTRPPRTREMPPPSKSRIVALVVVPRH